MLKAITLAGKETIANAPPLEKMKELSLLKQQEKKACWIIDTEIEKQKKLIEHLQNERSAAAGVIEEKIKNLEDEIKSLVPKRALSFSCKFGQAKFKRGYDRRNYDVDALDSLAAADEAIKKVIYPFRDVTAVAPSVTIKVEVPI